MPLNSRDTFARCEASAQTGTRTILGQALDGFAWIEAFVLIGVHCFWMLSKSSPLGSDNTWSAVLAIVPFVLMILLGIASFSVRIRAALISLEAFFHWSACLLQTVLLFYVVMRDPFESIVPLAAPTVVWSVALSFVLAANLAVHLRSRTCLRPHSSAFPVWISAILTFAWWAGATWLLSGATWIVYFWSASVVLHALLPCVTPRKTTFSFHSAKRLDSALAVVEALALMSLLLLTQVRVVDGLVCEGTLETKFLMYADVFRSPAFGCGFLLFVVGAVLRAAPLTHCAAAALLVFSAKEQSWPVAMAFGYALPGLFLSTRRLGGFAYSVLSLLVAFAWLLGLAGFAFAGMVVYFQMYADVVTTLIRWSEVSLALWLALGLAGYAITVFKRKKENRAEASSNATSAVPSGVARALLYFAVVCIAVGPGAALVWKTAWPPFVLERPASIAVDSPMGLCHAGYSESDDEYRILAELGVQAVRADFTWSQIQPAPGKWDFGSKENYVDVATRHGVRVIALLDFDNDSVEQDAVGKTRGMYIAPSDVPLFLEYVRQCVGHFKGRVYAWEVWNEPDIDRFWAGPMEEFYSLAGQTAAAIREADESAHIIGTAMTGPLGVMAPAGIEGLHASGALKNVEHPSCHLYVTDPRHYYCEFQKIIAAARRFNHPGAPWITEMGMPDGGHYPWCGAADRLAEYVIKSYTIATSLGLDMAVWYCFRDADQGSQAKIPIDAERFFGLLGPNDQWKPSAHAYRLFSRSCSKSTIRSGLVEVSGGLAARQVRSALYRRENGDSTLILWFEPMLRPCGRARICIDFGKTPEPPIMHDIGSEYSKVLLQDIEIWERPVLITYKASSADQCVRIKATSSPVDLLWLLSMAALTIASPVSCFRRTGRRA